MFSSNKPRPKVYLPIIYFPKKVSHEHIKVSQTFQELFKRFCSQKTKKMFVKSAINLISFRIFHPHKFEWVQSNAEAIETNGQTFFPPKLFTVKTTNQTDKYKKFPKCEKLLILTRFINFSLFLSFPSCIYVR